MLNWMDWTDWAMIAVIIGLLIWGMTVLSGCATPHERMCQMVADQYAKTTEPEEAHRYFKEYMESCYAGHK